MPHDQPPEPWHAFLAPGIEALARAAPLDLAVLEGRYSSELRPYLANAERHDLTLRLWLEMLASG
jgi:hypothetical protein